MRLASQRGFSLLEVIVATALTIGVVLATTSAVANSLHGSAVADLHMAMNDDALSALADVRAVSAYDAGMLAHLSGKSATMTRTASSGALETIAITLAPGPVPPPQRGVAAPQQDVIATATVTSGDITVTQTQTLSWEAPAPGSSVNQP